VVVGELLTQPADLGEVLGRARSTECLRTNSWELRAKSDRRVRVGFDLPFSLVVDWRR
jgi:hypothetical protein